MAEQIQKPLFPSALKRRASSDVAKSVEETGKDTGEH